MDELVVDIHNRCTRICRCTQEKYLLTASAGPVKGFSGLKYCIHKTTSGSKISDVAWNGEKLEVLKYIDQFKNVDSITTYYYASQAVGVIRKPLLIRVRNLYDHKIYWYENLGHSANKKWRRLYQYESEDYPEDYKNISKTPLEIKLKALICRLHLGHAIHINIKGEHEINCQICSVNTKVEVDEEIINGASEYKKRSYSNLVDGCVLLYNGRPISFRKRSSETLKGYFIPVQMDENVAKVSVYYWKGDDGHKNPLLLEIVGKFGYSVWLENFSKDVKTGEPKHDKWRYIDQNKLNINLYSTDYLKKKLDVLNCVYNATVQITLGATICHDPQFSSAHKDRISYSYDGITNTYPPIYTHTYNPNDESNRKPFNVSEIYVKDQKQEIDGGLPFIDVKRLIAYVSPCDKDNPFLIFVESGSSMGNKWYKKIRKGVAWDGHNISNSPENAKSIIDDLFHKLSTSLTIWDCNISTSTFSIKLDITKTLVKGQPSITYYDKSNPKTKDTPIIVTKDVKNVPRGFFKNIHKATTDVGHFTLNRQSQVGGNIGPGTMIEGVKYVEVHFWNEEPHIPILVTVAKKRVEPMRFGRGPGRMDNMWMSSQVDNMDEQQALDHQNCQLNNAIPIDLSDPKNIEQFKSNRRTSHCLTDDIVKQSTDLSLPHGAKNVYEAKAYKINDKKRISRLMYKLHPTNIRPPYKEYGPTLNIYSWTGEPGVPLIVEFINTDGKHEWYENLGEDPNYQKWRKIDGKVSNVFYENQKDLTEKFTDKLYEVNCKVNKIVQIDILRQYGKYCHEKCTPERIKVTISKEHINEYAIYEHKPADTSKTLMVSSILYNGKEQHLKSIYLPKEISKVTVYFPNCNGRYPIMIRIKDDSGGDLWLKRISNNNWENAIGDFTGHNLENVKNILNGIRNSMHACDLSKNSSPAPLPKSSFPSQGPVIDHNIEKVDKQNAVKNFFADDTGDDEDVENNFDNNEYDDETIKAYVTEYDFFRPSSVTYAPQQTAIHINPSNPPSSALKGAPSGLIIDIQQDLPSRSTSGVELYWSGADAVQLLKTEDPSHSAFYRFTHWLSNGESFEITKVNYGGKEIPDIKPKKHVTSYSVWYWTKDDEMKEPLMIEIEGNDEKYTYKYSKGNSGSSWNIPYGKSTDDESPLSGEYLEKELDDLNCYLNQAVTMDLSNSRKNGGLYCCGKGHGKKRVTVKHVEKKINSVYMEYYVHSINEVTNTKLAKIKYYLDKDNDQRHRKRIKSSDLQIPIPGPLDVYVFYCQKNPALIYIKKNRSQSGNKWYKRAGPTDYEGEWEEIFGQLNDITSTDLDNLDCQKQGKLVEVLKKVGCISLEKCSGAHNLRGHHNSSVDVVSAPQDPEITIQLSQKPNDKKMVTQYLNSNKMIEVTRSPYKTDFYKYTHTLYPNGKQFKLVKILDDTGKEISGIPQGEDASSVSAYYWKHDKDNTGNPTKALLVGISMDFGTTDYYRNTKESEWTKHTIGNPGKATQAELDLLNCDLNDVVQIDITKTESYCHNPLDSHIPHDTKKVKVVKVDDHDHLGNYTAYAHTPNTAEHSGVTKVNISGFKKGEHGIQLKSLQLPVMGASKVIVYFCRKKLYIPLLIYVPQATGGNNWFKKPDSGSTWEPVSGNGLTDDSKTQEIIDLLDGIESDCKPPNITIDIYNRGNQIQQDFKYENTSLIPKRTINVTSKDIIGIVDFTEYIHTVHGREKSYFTVSNFLYNSEKTQGSLGKTERVTSVSVYYCSQLESPYKQDKQRGRPLLVNITTKQDITGVGTREIYYENIGTNENSTRWNLWRLGNISQLDIQKKLHLLNCKLNNAVVIDVSKVSGDNNGSNSIQYDSCEYNDKQKLDPSHGERMQVKKDDNSSQSLGNYVAYTHKLKDSSSGKKFHVVGFQNGNNSRTNLTGIGSPPLPILDVGEVKVYMCGTNPLLVYIKTSDPKFGSKKWWKYNGNKTWQEVTQDPPSDTKRYDWIRGVLNELNSQCKPQDVASSGPVAAANRGGGGTSSGNSNWQVIFGGSASATVVSGSLTGLGWWAFKRSKGDPWTFGRILANFDIPSTLKSIIRTSLFISSVYSSVPFLSQILFSSIYLTFVKKNQLNIHYFIRYNFLQGLILSTFQQVMSMLFLNVYPLHIYDDFVSQVLFFTALFTSYGSVLYSGIFALIGKFPDLPILSDAVKMHIGD